MKAVGSVLMAAILVAFASANAMADGINLAVGGGFSRNNIDNQVNDDDFDGFFVVFRGVLENGFLFTASLSRVEEDFTTIVGPIVINEEDTVTRLELGAGYMFRPGEVFRPFLHGGLSLLRGEINGTLGDGTTFSGELLDDDSIVLTVGAGFEVGSEHHAFYFDLSFDDEHEGDFNLGVEIRFSPELNLGYIYRF